MTDIETRKADVLARIQEIHAALGSSPRTDGLLAALASYVEEEASAELPQAPAAPAELPQAPAAPAELPQAPAAPAELPPGHPLAPPSAAELRAADEATAKSEAWFARVRTLTARPPEDPPSPQTMRCRGCGGRSFVDSSLAPQDRALPLAVEAYEASPVFRDQVGRGRILQHEPVRPWDPRSESATADHLSFWTIQHFRTLLSGRPDVQAGPMLTDALGPDVQAGPKPAVLEASYRCRGCGGRAFVDSSLAPQDRALPLAVEAYEASPVFRDQVGRGRILQHEPVRPWDPRSESATADHLSFWTIQHFRTLLSGRPDVQAGPMLTAALGGT